jgi:chromate transporter
MLYLKLFWEFFKTGLFAVGGGMATVPFLQDMAARTGWFTTEMLVNMIAVSESTPGPIGVNMATYTGFTVGGPLGAVIATLGLATPSITVILIVAAMLKAFRDNKYVDRIFYGIRPASTALISSAWITVVTICLIHIGAFRASGLISDLFDWRNLVLFAVLWLATNKIPKVKKWHPLAFIGIAAAVGIVFNFAG